MADTKREIERKYESDDSGLPDLTGVAGVASVVDKGVAHLDATYYDTPDERLAAAAITLRRRTGGSDAGWHLKFPVAPGVRDEIRAPLSDTVPRSLAGLVRSRVRDAELRPVVRLLSDRDVRDLIDAAGPAARRGQRRRRTRRAAHRRRRLRPVDRAGGGTRRRRRPGLPRQGRQAAAQGGRTTVRVGVEARASADGDGTAEEEHQETGREAAGRQAAQAKARPRRPATTSSPTSANSGTPSSPSTRPYGRTRTTRCTACASPPAGCAAPSARTRKVLDRTVTDPIGEELKWLAGELGVDRDARGADRTPDGGHGRTAQDAALRPGPHPAAHVDERPPRRLATPADRRPGLQALPGPARQAGRAGGRPAAAGGGRRNARGRRSPRPYARTSASCRAGRAGHRPGARQGPRPRPARGPQEGEADPVLGGGRRSRPRQARRPPWPSR